MPQDLAKTLSFLGLHLTVGFAVAYAFTGSASLAGGIALVEPCVNAVVFFFHEKAWRGNDRRGNAGRENRQRNARRGNPLSFLLHQHAPAPSASHRQRSIAA